MILFSWYGLRPLRQYPGPFFIAIVIIDHEKMDMARCASIRPGMGCRLAQAIPIKLLLTLKSTKQAL